MGAQGSAARLVDPANGPGTPYGGVGDEGQARGGGQGEGTASLSQLGQFYSYYRLNYAPLPIPVLKPWAFKEVVKIK